MSAQQILMGVVGRPHGVRGLVRVRSYAAVPADLARYGELSDERGGRWTLSWRGEGIAQLVGADGGALRDREQAAALVNRKLFVPRDRLPTLDEDEFYLADLIGLAAVERGIDGEQRPVGTVVAVHEYGAGASLEIRGEHGELLLPFTRRCVPEVQLAAALVVVVVPDEVEVPDERSLEPVA